ncbi:MAG: AEC family transporter, partial [Pseudomonadota bacterium]
MAAVLSALLPIFALIALGLHLRRSGLIPEPHWASIERLCFWALFPALLLTTLARTAPPTGEAARLALALVMMMLGMAALSLASRRVLVRALGIGYAAYTTLFQAGVRWHGFVALAVVLNLHGEAAVALVAIGLAALAPIGNASAVAILARYGDRAGAAPASFGGVLRQIALNPVIWACAAGIGLNLAGIGLWPPVEAFLDLLGRAALGLGMLAIGAALSVRAALRPSGAALVGVALKLVAAPALALFL